MILWNLGFTKGLVLKKVYNSAIKVNGDVISHEPIIYKIKNRNIHGHTHDGNVIDSPNKHLNVSADAINHTPLKYSDKDVKIKRSKHKGSRYKPGTNRGGAKYDIKYTLG